MVFGLSFMSLSGGFLRLNMAFQIGQNRPKTASPAGTSLAAAVAAGVATIVREYFVRGMYPSGAPLATDTIDPSVFMME